MAVVVTDTEDLSLASKVRTYFGQAKQARRSRIETWNRSYRVVHNRAWSPLRESWMASPSASEVFPIIAAMVGWMTDQRPSLSVVAAMDPHSATAEFYQRLARDLELTLQGNWMSSQSDAEVEKVLWDAMIYGTGFFKVGWDPALAGGMGDAQLARVDPFRFYPDPAGTSMNDCNYFVEARTMSLQELDRRFPGSVSRLMDQGFEDAGLDKRENIWTSNGRTPMANPGGVGGAAPAWGRPGGSSRDESSLFDDSVTVYECWMRENEHSENDEGEEFVEDSWRVVCVAGNQVLLNERATEIFGHGRHPYERYVLHDLGEFWGVSLVEHLTPLQVSLNRLLAAMQSNAELIGNPIFKEDTRSGIARTQITNRPGARLTVNPGAQAEWLTPPEMPSHIPNLIQFYIGEMERVSGLSAIVRGATPTGRNAQGVLDSVQEAAFVRVRLALRNLERSLRNVGELLASLIVENYTVPRLVAIVGAQGEKNAIALTGRHFMVPTEAGATPMKFQLWVQAGSSLPISRQARAQEADTLFALGAIDHQAVLEAHDYPNRDEIVRRVQQSMAAGLLEPPGKRERARA